MGGISSDFPILQSSKLLIFYISILRVNFDGIQICILGQVWMNTTSCRREDHNIGMHFFAHTLSGVGWETPHGPHRDLLAIFGY